MRTARRLGAAALGTAVLAGTFAAIGTTTASAAPAAVTTADPTPLFSEDFEGASVPDPAWRGLNAACLTKATAAPAAGASNLGVCASRVAAPDASAETGYLQLTDATGSQTGGAVLNRPIPGNGGLVVEFDQYQYGGGGADGIGFFLVDGATDLTRTGAAGGSLGYANSRNFSSSGPGVEGGYLGVGLDAYGNFANGSEVGGRECFDAGQRGRNNVGLRGPGSGDSGYCWLGGTFLSDRGLSVRGNDLSSARRTVRVTVSPETVPLVSVDMDFHDGQGLRQVLSQRMPDSAPAPATYKLGFLGATGGVTDVHLVNKLDVAAVEELTALNLTKEVVPDPDDPDRRYDAGESIPFRFTVTNTTDAPVTGLTFSDDVTEVGCDAPDLGAAGSATATTECTGEHVVTEVEAASGTYDGATTVSASQGEGRVSSNRASVDVPVGVDPVVPVAQPTTTDLTVTADGMEAVVAPVTTGAETRRRAAAQAAPTGEVVFGTASGDLDTVELVPNADGTSTAVSDATVAPGAVVDFEADYTGSEAYDASGDTYQRTDPTITHEIVTDEVPNAAGWYNEPLRITFACAEGSAPLTRSCPGPISRSNTHRDRAFTRTVTATDGGADTISVPVRVDRRGPVLTITQRAGSPYPRSARPVSCSALDDRSGVLGACEVTYGAVVTGRDGVSRRSWTARARDVAGNVSVRRNSFVVRAR